jgi:hypothetical protein
MPYAIKARNIISSLFVIIFLYFKNIVYAIKRSNANIIKSKYSASGEAGGIFISAFR